MSELDGAKIAADLGALIAERDRLREQVEFLTIQGKRDKASYGDLLSRFEAAAVKRHRMSERVRAAVDVIGERASSGKQHDIYAEGRRDEADLCEQEIRAALEGGDDHG